jgi:membrane protease YdiL (CAAX protease family)
MAFLLILVVAWLTPVAVRFRTSRPILLGGLLLVTVAAFVLIARGDIRPDAVGLVAPTSWLFATVLSIAWTGLMLLATPVADRIATRFFAQPPQLGAFRALKESRLKLIAGIVFAWIAGGFLEELALRGVVQNETQALLAGLSPPLVATAVAILAGALGAFVIHLYQGLRAAFIVTQLSLLFGLLFVLGGHTLWTQLLAHGLYDTIAFIRFATGTSKYSKFDASDGNKASGETV